MKYHYAVDQVAKYPSDAAYSGRHRLCAVASSARACAPPASSSIPNFGGWSGYRTAVDAWLPYVSGGMEEQFGKWGTRPGVGYVTGNGWERQLGALKATQAAGKLFVAISHSQANDAAAARYGWATTLLGSRGNDRLRAGRRLHERDLVPRVRLRPRRCHGRGGQASQRRAPPQVPARPRAGQPDRRAGRVSFGGTYSGSGLTHATRRHAGAQQRARADPRRRPAATPARLR